MLQGGILVFATMVMDQQRRLSVAVDARVEQRVAHVGWPLGFEALSFADAVLSWAPRTRDG